VKLFSLFTVIVLRGFGSGVSVLLAMLISRYLSTGDAARFFLLFNASTIAAICFRWGFDEVIIRRIASSAVDEAPRLARQLIRQAHLRVFTWAFFFILVALSLLHPFIRSILFGLTTSEILVVVAASSMIALVACASRVQQGIGRANLATFFLNCFVPSFFLAGFLILVGIKKSIDASALLIMYAFVASTAYAIVVTAGYGGPLAMLRTEPSAIESEYIAQDKLAANKLGGVVMAQQAINWTAFLVVPIAYGDAVYNGFVVTHKVTLLISLFMLACNFAFSSRFATLYSTGQILAIRHLIKLSILMILSASLLVSVTIVVFWQMIINFARIEAGMGGVLAALLLSQVLFSLASQFSLVLSMCRDDNFLLVTQAATNAGGVVIFLLLSYFAQIEVACSAFVVSYLALAAVLGYRVRGIVAG